VSGELHPGAIFEDVHSAILSSGLDDATSSPREPYNRLQFQQGPAYRKNNFICKIYDYIELILSEPFVHHLARVLKPAYGNVVAGVKKHVPIARLSAMRCRQSTNVCRPLPHDHSVLRKAARPALRRL
jgi:hypothetical protein